MSYQDTNPQTNKQSTVEAAPAKSTAAQSYLDIDQVRDGVVIIKDGSMRMVLKATAVNFELKSELERNGIIYGYQNFLNSIEFPIQIIVQSRRLDLDLYLSGLREKTKSITNELLQAQSTDYINFIEQLVTVANIMEKHFYIVVPHYPAQVKKVGGLTKLFTPNAGTVAVSDFEEEKRYLMQKVETVAGGMRGVGVYAIQLKTQELIELYYNVYNPEEATVQKLIDISQLESEIISEIPDEMNID